MTAKFDNFVAALEQLCVEHGAGITTTHYGDAGIAVIERGSLDIGEHLPQNFVDWTKEQ